MAAMRRGGGIYIYRCMEPLQTLCWGKLVSGPIAALLAAIPGVR